jgi:hypothetical protein
MTPVCGSTTSPAPFRGESGPQSGPCVAVQAASTTAAPAKTAIADAAGTFAMTLSLREQATSIIGRELADHP